MKIAFHKTSVEMDIQSSLSQVDQLINQINTLRPINAEQEARVLAKFRLDWNFHSNAIEGNSLSYGETKAFLLHGITAKGKPFKDYLDIKGHDQVIDLLADLVRKREELTEALIRELHKILLVEPYVEKVMGPDGIVLSRRVEIGRYKTSANYVRTATGKLHYFASPAETNQKMAELVQWYRDERQRNELHPVVLAAVFHHRFVAIHPFDDGNGRMARILMNFMLMQAGYVPVVLRAEKRDEYFFALAKADEGENEDLIGFVLGAEIDAATLFLRAARGEVVDELSDFDKRLRLLAQSLKEDSEIDIERTQAIQNQIIADFVAPLFGAVGQRFVHFEKLFGHRDLSLMWSSNGQAYGTRNQELAARLEDLKSQTRGIVIENTYLQLNARAFIKDPRLDFFCRLEVFFHPSRISVTFHVTGKPADQVFSSGYASLPSQIEAEDVAKAVLDRIVQSFANLADRSTSRS